MEECIFCKIVNKEIPAKFAYEDNLAVAIYDINPQAPVHILIIPKKHIPTILDFKKDDKDLIYHVYEVISKIAKKEKIDNDGFRVVANCNSFGGQTVFHIHFHLLGGRRMKWPPG
jgi:histidine triad (HIT) family protein